MKKNERMVDVVAIPIVDKFYQPIEELFNETSSIEIAAEIYNRSPVRKNWRLYTNLEKVECGE